LPGQIEYTMKPKTNKTAITYALRRILVPVDFSDPSRQALSVAERVVQLAPCPVLVVR